MATINRMPNVSNTSNVYARYQRNEVSKKQEWRCYVGMKKEEWGAIKKEPTHPE